MDNIIKITNQIGEEVERTLRNNDSKLYFQETILLYSLEENLLKFIVAANDCWVESGNKVDEVDKIEKETGGTLDERDLYVDFQVIRTKAARLTFAQTIEKARKTELINDELCNVLHDSRKKRNSLIHQLYLFHERNNSSVIREKLIAANEAVLKLKPIFENLLFDKIGFSDSDLPELYQPL